ncbi:g4445 [Coccomyxa elongata]
MTREDLEEGEIEEGEIVDEVLQPDILRPHLPVEAHPAPEAKPETLPPPPALPGPPPANANSSQWQAPVAATPPPQPVHFSFRRVRNARKPVWQDAAPLHATLWTVQVNGMQQGQTAPAKLGSAAQQRSSQQEAPGKEPTSSRSHASVSERHSEERRRVPSPRSRDARGRSPRSVSHSHSGHHARSPRPPKQRSPPRKRRENLREREFREQQKDSSSTGVPRSRSSSEEAGQIMVKAPASADARVPGQSRTPPSGQDADRMDRSASKAASETGHSKSRDRAHRETCIETEKERAEWKQREAERLEGEERARLERRKRQEEWEAQKREERRRRQTEAEEQRRRDREEREKRESVRDAGQLADSIKQLCQDCTTKHIMKSLDTVTRNLLAALGKLYSLHRLQKKLKEAGLQEEVQLAELVAGLLEGLRHLSVFSQTGAGRSTLRAHTDARELVRSAMRNRHALCTISQQGALESIVKSSTVFTGFVSGEQPPQPPAKEKGSVGGGATEPPGLAAAPHANGIAPAGHRDANAAEKRPQPRASATQQPASKRQRRDEGHDPLQHLPGQLSTHRAATENGAPAAEPLGSPASPPTPPSEPGEFEPQQDFTDDMELVSDLSDSQNLYAVDDEAEVEVTSSGADEYIPFCPDTPPESPKRAFPAPDAPASGAPEKAAAEITVPGLCTRSIGAQPASQPGTRETHAPSPISNAAADARLHASRQPGASSAGPPHVGNQPGVGSAGHGTAMNERHLGDTSTSGRGAHSAYRQEGPVGALLRERRLCLVLDLDHTLVNSAKFSEVEPEHLLLLERQLQREARLPQEERRLFRLDHISMWTVLRPGLRHLLATVAPLFQLWIQTNASRAYALAVAQLLDPSGELFRQRIISKGDDGSLLTNQSKRLMQGLEECEAVCIIVDDSNDVWRHHAHNLLHVERYIYFPSSRRQLKVRRATFLEAQNDECAKEGILAVTLNVLLAIHKAVFAALDAPAATDSRDERDWDVRHVLGSMRKQVLPGVRVLFSRVFPLDQEPESHHLWKLAETYGAVCTTDLDDRVTHVVAHSRGTQKCQWALQAGKHVVSPAWLECSCTLWHRAKESAFPAPS